MVVGLICLRDLLFSRGRFFGLLGVAFGFTRENFLKKVFPNPFKNFSKWAWVDRPAGRKPRVARLRYMSDTPLASKLAESYQPYLLLSALRASGSFSPTLFLHHNFVNNPAKRDFITEGDFTATCVILASCYVCAPLRTLSTSQNAEERRPPVAPSPSGKVSGVCLTDEAFY